MTENADSKNHKPDIYAQIIFFWVQKLVTCVFCTKSFTEFSLGQYLSVRFLPCKNDGMFSYGFDFFWCHCSVVYHINFVKVSWCDFLYILLYILLFVGFGKLCIFFIIFYQNHISDITLSLHGRKTYISIFDHEFVLLYLW